MPILWLADALTEAGVTVVEEGDWRNRSAGADFAPIGVLWHHTAGPVTSAENPHPSLGICIDGRSDLPGPLCHAVVDFNGVFHLVSANRANHAGASGGSGPIPAGDGNTLMVGWEIDYAGDQSGTGGPKQEMSPAQYDASLKATAAVLKRLGRDAQHARGHRETSTSGKIDPSFVNLDTMRADVAKLLPPPPAGTPFETWVAGEVYPEPNTGKPAVGTVQPGTIYVECEAVGEEFTGHGYTNNRWAKLSAPVAGYLNNVHVKGPAALPVDACPI